MTYRDEILKLLEANAGTILENLSEFWFRHAEDLQAAGLDPATLARSLIDVAVSHLIKAHGTQGTAAELRRVYQFVKRLEVAVAADPNCSQARH